MNILYLVIPLLIVLFGLIGYAVWWSYRRGLFNDLQGPQHWCRQPREDDQNEQQSAIAENLTLQRGEQSEDGWRTILAVDPIAADELIRRSQTAVRSVLAQSPDRQEGMD